MNQPDTVTANELAEAALERRISSAAMRDEIAEIRPSTRALVAAAQQLLDRNDDGRAAWLLHQAAQVGAFGESLAPYCDRREP